MNNKLLLTHHLSIKKKTAILGIGTDICHLDRIENLYHRFQDKFLKRIFSVSECAIFKNIPNNKKISYLAKRFAVKESVAKALQKGIGQYVYFTEISCISHYNCPPKVILTGKTHETALRLAQDNHYNAYHIHVSLSDEIQHALAFIILEGI